MSFQDQYQWQIRFIRQVKYILADHFIQITAPHIDKAQVSDLMTADIPGGLSVSVRIRKPGWSCYEFTIRKSAPPGYPSEYDKIIRGAFANYFLYAHESVITPYTIDKFVLLDMTAFRRAHIACGENIGNRQPKTNIDGTSFYVFDLRFIPIDYQVVLSANFQINGQAIYAPVQQGLWGEE